MLKIYTNLPEARNMWPFRNQFSNVVWQSLPAVNTLNCDHGLFLHGISLRIGYFDWWLQWIKRRKSQNLEWRSIRHRERRNITLLKPYSREELWATLRLVIKPSSNQHFKLWPAGFSPFYSTQDSLFCLTISANQKLQQPTPWADTRFETAKDSPWHCFKRYSWVKLSATLGRVITPSSSWHFKLWPSAFFLFHSAQERQFSLMTSMNQKLQKPNSWVTLDYKQREARHDIPQNHAVEWKFLQLYGAWYSLSAANTLNCGHRRFFHSFPLRKLYFVWWLL